MSRNNRGGGGGRRRNKAASTNNNYDSDCQIVDYCNESGVINLDSDDDDDDKNDKNDQNMSNILEFIRLDVEQSIRENSVYRNSSSQNDNDNESHNNNIENDDDDTSDDVIFYEDLAPGLNPTDAAPLYNVRPILNKSPTIDEIVENDQHQQQQQQTEKMSVETPDTSSIDESVIFCGEVIELEKIRSPRKRPEPKSPPASAKIVSVLDLPMRRPVASQVKKKIVQIQSNMTNNTYIPEKAKQTSGKRIIIMDGSNVAFGHSNGRNFSVRGIEICLRFFEKKGHEIKAVVPQSRFRRDQSTDQTLLERLKNEGKLIITPAKNLPGNRSISYDDRFILQVATEFNAAIISNDNYRDLIQENPKWKEIIESRVIGYTWFKDMFMVPEDPYGRNGPTLDQILNI